MRTPTAGRPVSRRGEITGVTPSRRGAAPTIVLGEWGGPTTGANGKWMGALVQYLQDKGIESNFFWALNQDGSPEGIITDWTATPPAVDAGKLAVLAKLTPKPTRFDPSCYIAAAPESR